MGSLKYRQLEIDGANGESLTSSVPHNALSHSANDEFLHGCPSFESPVLSQQRYAAFPSERDLRAERCASAAPGSRSEARAEAVRRRLQAVVERSASRSVLPTLSPRPS